MKAKTYKSGDCRITKIRMIREVNNCMCHNFYFEIKWRVYAGELAYYRGNFVVWFDTDDLYDFYEKDTFSKADVKGYAEELAGCFLSDAPLNPTAETMRPFFAKCRESIEHYNGTRAA